MKLTAMLDNWKTRYSQHLMNLENININFVSFSEIIDLQVLKRIF
jgi:hypothetical protein